jgi:hypothetical protein
VQARLLGGEHRRELAPARGEVRQGACGRRARRAHRRLDECGVLGEDPRVEAVRLAEHPEGAGEVPDAVRRDDDDRHRRGVERVDERALPAAGGLHDDARGRELAEPRDEAAQAGRRVRDAGAAAAGVYVHVERGLRHVDADEAGGVRGARGRHGRRATGHGQHLEHGSGWLR